MKIQSISAVPKPDFLIKSIAEQGYSLESAIADLIDNSISANANNIQVLVDTDNEPFTLFLADDGEGMSSQELVQNMNFPSSDPEKARQGLDLGRFGLGMKSASFSQTRKFTVISRKKGSSEFSGLTWDVEHLSKTKKWELLVNDVEEINTLLEQFFKLDKEFLNQTENFVPNTIIIWSGLYKFEKYLEKQNRKNALTRDIVENTTEHLGIVFHRYLEQTSKPLKIRLNNSQIQPFNPFPENQQSLRKLEYKQKDFGHDNIKLEGFILPSSCIKESKSLDNIWTTSRKSLSDMEGVYIYRSNRLIIYGGWNGLIRNAPRLQLARLRVDIGNHADHLIHLNVSKSKVIIPHDLINAFKGYIEELTTEAEKEFFNRGIRRFSEKSDQKEVTLFSKIHSNKGPLLELNQNFPILKELISSVNKTQHSQLLLLIRMISTSVNKMRNTHEDIPLYRCKEAKDTDLIKMIENLIEQGFSKSFIKENVINELGIDLATLPEDLLKVLE